MISWIPTCQFIAVKEANANVIPRQLQETPAETECKSDYEMRKYFQDKVIVVYVAESYVAQDDQIPNQNELITYLNPIVTKQLDFRLSKSVNMLVKEINMEI